MCKELTAVCKPGQKGSSHAPQATEPGNAENENGFRGFCREKPRLGEQEMHFKAKYAQTPAGRAHGSPEGQQLLRQCRNLPAEAQLHFFFPLWPPSLPQLNPAIQGNAIHHHSNPRACHRPGETSRPAGLTKAFVLAHSEEHLGVQTLPCSLCNPNIAALS